MRVEGSWSAALASALFVAAGTVAVAQEAEAPPQESPAQMQDGSNDALTSLFAETPAPESVAETVPVIELSTSPEPLPEPTEAAPRAHQLEEIVVTATKREKSLRDIPQSIDAFKGEDLETSGKVNLADYLEQSPGVTLTTAAPGLVRITIRGVGVETSSLSAQPSPTGIFINETAFTDPYISGVQPDLSAFDLASVELLKGPQGTLFGGAALAGAVRYILQDPVMGQWEAKGFSQVVAPREGSTAVTSGATLNVPLYEDRLAARLVYVDRNYPGITDDVRPDPPKRDVDKGEGTQMRGLLTWQPLDELTFKFVHLMQDYSAPNSAAATLSLERREFDHLVLEQPVSNDFSLDTLTVEYEFDTVKAVSLTSRTDKHLSVFADGTPSLIGNPPPGYPAILGGILAFNDDSEALAQEFRLQSTGSGNFQWLAGAYFYNYDVDFDILVDLVAHQALLGNESLLAQLLSGTPINLESLAAETSLLYAVTDVKATERAGFLDLSYQWNDLELSAGARVYETEVDGGFRGYGVIARQQNNGQAIDFSSNSIKENGINPKFSALYHANENMSFYAQASKGFRFGGLQSVPSTPMNNVPKVYKSDSLWSYESGIRTQWLDNTLRLDLTAFYIKYKDPQIQQATTGPVPLNYTDNVGGAISKGLEASFRWVTPLDGLTLSVDGGYTDAYTTEEFETSTGFLVPRGAQMPGSAKTSYSVAAAYLRPLGSFLLGGTAEYSYIGKGYADLIGGPERAINDYGTLNLGVTAANEAWSLRPAIALTVSNVLDVTAAKTAAPREGTTQIEPYTLYLLNQPRTLTARVSLSF